MIKKSGLIIAIFLLVLAIISLILYFQANDKKVYSDELINKVSTGFKKSLKSFVSSADKSMANAKTALFNSDKSLRKKNDLDNLFVSQMVDNKLLKGIILFSNNLNYVIIREDKTWATTYSYKSADSLLNWTRLDDKLNVISNWSDTYNFFMDKTNRNSVKLKKDSSGIGYWRSVLSQIPGKRELIVNVSGFEDGKGKNYTIGLIYKTSEIAKGFSEIFSFQNPLVNIIDERGILITPIKTDDTTKIADYKNLTLEIEKLVTSWKNNRQNQPNTYSFEKHKQVYWTRIDTLDNKGLKGFAITVSENDINNSISLLVNKYLYASIILFVLGAAILLLSLLKRKKTKAENNELIKFEKQKLKKLITGGETAKLELKSSLRFDYRQQKENKVLEDVILKSIAAFANAKGGTLIIGVKDDLDILGLENDFNTLKKPDADYFELHLNKLIVNQFGISFINESLLVYFEEFDEKTICIIRINPSAHPLYLKTKDKNGQQIEKFYVRSGNSSQQISSLKEINDYIRRRFRRHH
jgi:hypothetical protein